MIGFAFGARSEARRDELIDEVERLANRSRGAGAIRGFAVVLVLGIGTSVFTSVMGSHALVQIIYGGRRKLDHLSI